MTTRLTLLERRNFVSAMWHGAFLALGVALTQPTTVIAAFVADLTGSTIWVGGLLTVLTVAGALPQIFVARWIEPRPRKMPCLMVAIYLRVVSWGALAGLTFAMDAAQVARTFVAPAATRPVFCRKSRRFIVPAFQVKSDSVSRIIQSLAATPFVVSYWLGIPLSPSQLMTSTRLSILSTPSTWRSASCKSCFR